MNAADRLVRAAAYQAFIDGDRRPDLGALADATGFDSKTVGTALEHLAAERRLVLTADGRYVAMAHPFSSAETGYRAVIGDQSWSANCGWDAFAILALLGDGEAHGVSPVDSTTTTWTVGNGKVSPGGLVHFVVPARSFWDDIEFT